MDFGALVAGYHTDMTRTVAFGEPVAELRKVHDVVAAAQQAGIDALRPGALAADVDRAARSVIEDAGYGDRFTHGLGHGVGLEIHEGPSLRREGEDVDPGRRRGDRGAGRLPPRTRRRADRRRRRGERGRPRPARDVHPRADRAVAG